ncbi:MAG: hypothetical protein HeimC3_31610 [Candidatus Heimdallarchaeota archaeon LC_3]|nr:MAG: hypothetical protein HeimC3_31610 [Candidatus Heimdallarchaeota archaeon LC_3]
MKIISKDENITETFAVITVKDREPSIKLKTLFGLFWIDSPCMHKFYSINENINNKLNLLNGGPQL